MKPKVHVTGAELAVIDAIVNRALVHFPDREARDIKMDVLATHLTKPLRLNELLDSRDMDFVHDIVGIERHLNRRTFTLSDGFSPRFTA
jgi:hypothetical protein